MLKRCSQWDFRFPQNTFRQLKLMISNAPKVTLAEKKVLCPQYANRTNFLILTISSSLHLQKPLMSFWPFKHYCTSPCPYSPNKQSVLHLQPSLAYILDRIRENSFSAFSLILSCVFPTQAGQSSHSVFIAINISPYPKSSNTAEISSLIQIDCSLISLGAIASP